MQLLGRVGVQEALEAEFLQVSSSGQRIQVESWKEKKKEEELLALRQIRRKRAWVRELKRRVLAAAAAASAAGSNDNTADNTADHPPPPSPHLLLGAAPASPSSASASSSDSSSTTPPPPPPPPLMANPLMAATPELRVAELARGRLQIGMSLLARDRCVCDVCECVMVYVYVCCVRLVLVERLSNHMMIHLAVWTRKNCVCLPLNHLCVLLADKGDRCVEAS
jgi:hypothetical protein